MVNNRTSNLLWRVEGQVDFRRAVEASDNPAHDPSSPCSPFDVSLRRHILAREIFTDPLDKEVVMQ